MYHNIKHGGLKFLNIEIQIKALHLNWIKRFYNSNKSKWKEIFNVFIPFIQASDLFLTRCDFDLSILNIPLFYKEVIMAWQEIQSTWEPSTAEQIRKESLWFNGYLTREGKGFIFSKWYKKGIFLINDIVDDKGDFFTPDKLLEKYNLNVNFLEYYTIRHCIPYRWKEILKTKQCIIEKPNVPSLLIGSKMKYIIKLQCKDFYVILLEKHFTLTKPACIKKWYEELKCSECEFENIFMLPYNCTYETKLQSFQHSLTHRYINCNKWLFKVKLSLTAMCNI